MVKCYWNFAVSNSGKRRFPSKLPNGECKSDVNDFLFRTRVAASLSFYLKVGYPGLFFVYFGCFLNKQYILGTTYHDHVYPASGARIRTHDLLNTSGLPQFLTVKMHTLDNTGLASNRYASKTHIITPHFSCGLYGISKTCWVKHSVWVVFVQIV